MRSGILTAKWKFSDESKYDERFNTYKGGDILSVTGVYFSFDANIGDSGLYSNVTLVLASADDIEVLRAASGLGNIIPRCTLAPKKAFDKEASDARRLNAALQQAAKAKAQIDQLKKNTGPHTIQQAIQDSRLPEVLNPVASVADFDISNLGQHDREGSYSRPPLVDLTKNFTGLNGLEDVFEMPTSQRGTKRPLAEVNPVAESSGYNGRVTKAPRNRRTYVSSASPAVNQVVPIEVDDDEDNDDINVDDDLDLSDDWSPESSASQHVPTQSFTRQNSEYGDSGEDDPNKENRDPRGPEVMEK
ncbi:hypothetical protein BGX26_007332 [Mortierella sp. AD094]|nr:hypothetical protein BGX26_007332 [Mortierella sp. AD094]